MLPRAIRRGSFFTQKSVLYGGEHMASAKILEQKQAIVQSIADQMKMLQEASIEEIRITKDEVSRELCRRAKQK